LDGEDESHAWYRLTAFSWQLLGAPEPLNTAVETVQPAHSQPGRLVQWLYKFDPDVVDYVTGTINLLRWIWTKILFKLHNNKISARWAVRPPDWYLDVIFGLVYLSDIPH
jgi:hypothetical protein